MSTKKIINAILAILVFASSMGSYERPATFLIWAGALIVLTLVINWVVLRRYAGKGGLRRLILPVLLLVGLFGINLAISSGRMRWILTAGTAIVFYLYQIYFPEELPRNGEETAVLLTAALLFGFIWSLNFYFAWSWYYLLGLTLVLFFPLFTYAAPAGGGLFGTLIVLEMQWTLLYWPTHLITTTAVNFAGFYLIYVLSRLEAQRKLSAGQLYLQTGMTTAAVFLILLSSSWRQ